MAYVLMLFMPAYSSENKATPRLTGLSAERRACWLLRLRGWRICARNWIGGGGELDIVASRWRTLLIVEVRRRPTVEAAMASIDHAKVERTMKATRALVRQHGLERYRLRFDAIGIDPKGSLRWERDIIQTAKRV